MSFESNFGSNFESNFGSSPGSSPLLFNFYKLKVNNTLFSLYDITQTLPHHMYYCINFTFMTLYIFVAL